MVNLEAIKKNIAKFEKVHPLDELEPVREELKKAHKKGMTLTALCKVVRDESDLKPTAKALREWLGIPAKVTKPKKVKVSAPEKDGAAPKEKTEAEVLFGSVTKK